MPKRRKLLRLIVPAYPEFSIYSAMARKTTGLGLVLVASAANKLIGWEVEVFDENNCFKPLWPKNAEDGYIDHRELQKYRPADIVGFYGSMSSCIPRVYKLAKLYKELGAITVVGGYHARALPQDMLNHNIDIVAMSMGEETMLDIMRAYDLFFDAMSAPIDITASDSTATAAELLRVYLGSVSDVAFMSEDQLIRTPLKIRTAKCPPWPLPDFSLLKYAKIKTFPIIWRKGCPYNCEFCAVKERPESVPAEEFMARVEYLVEKFKAKHFFIVDDHFGGSLNNPDDYAETMKLLKLLQEYQNRIGKRLSFVIQIRLNMSEKTELLVEMRKAGIDMVCIGFESPIDAELQSMNKGMNAGYNSEDMIRWTKLWRDQGFFVHGMFIFAYPRDPEKDYEDEAGNPLPKYSVAERANIYRRFIKKAKIDTVQVLLTVPIPGTELWHRLEKEGRILHEIGYEYYDGQFPTFKPDNATPEEIQDAMKSVMGNFYGPSNIWKLFVNWLFHFPRIVFPSVVTLVTFRTRYIVSAYQKWRKKYHRNTWIKAGGWFVFKNWAKQLKTGDFHLKLQKAKEAWAEYRKKDNDE